LRPVFVVLEWLLALAALLLLLWRLLPFESWLLHLQAPAPAITAIQQRLYRQARAWGVAADAARTPHEFEQAFATQLERFAARPRLAPTVSALQSDLAWLTALYTRLLFSPTPPTSAEHHQAVRTWLRLRQSLRRLRYS
jgi:hypothetical protein